jgi:hypothetical protein
MQVSKIEELSMIEIEQVNGGEGARGLIFLGGLLYSATVE